MNQAFRIIHKLNTIGENLYEGEQLLGTFSSSEAAHQARNLLRNPHWLPTGRKLVLSAEDFNLCLALGRFESEGAIVDWNGRIHDLQKLDFDYTVMVDTLNRSVEVLGSDGGEIFVCDYHPSLAKLQAELAR